MPLVDLADHVARIAAASARLEASAACAGYTSAAPSCSSVRNRRRSGCGRSDSCDPRLLSPAAQRDRPLGLRQPRCRALRATQRDTTPARPRLDPSAAASIVAIRDSHARSRFRRVESGSASRRASARRVRPHAVRRRRARRPRRPTARPVARRVRASARGRRPARRASRGARRSWTPRRSPRRYRSAATSSSAQSDSVNGAAAETTNTTATALRRGSRPRRTRSGIRSAAPRPRC